MANRTFNFEGTNRNKFLIAGANYTSRATRSFSKNYEKLLQYTQQNLEQVCCDGASKGFCYGTCTTCPVQQAYKQAVQELMRRACREPQVERKKQTPKERTGKSWEEMRKENE